MKKKIISVVGARPNFMKVAPLDRAFRKYPEINHMICHTGQHYDENMSKIFFHELGLPVPHFFLGVGSGSHAEQTGKIMIEFEKICIETKPDMVIVVGDVNSTLACSVTAKKLMIDVAHIEAGLRSRDFEMPEEINRIVTDSISDYLFVTEKSGLENLTNEGVSKDKVFFTGNIMIDNLLYLTPRIDNSNILNQLNLETDRFILVTFHRPSNVDSRKALTDLVNFLNTLAHERKIVFPIHPRTLKNIKNYDLDKDLHKNVILIDPVGYVDFQKLLKHSEIVITDSGGIQEETTFLGVQCLTVRNNTERPVTVEVGTNQLPGTDLLKVTEVAMEILSGHKKAGSIPELWDGHAAERITEIITITRQKAKDKICHKDTKTRRDTKPW